MTRTEFNALYRSARLTLRFMASTSGRDKHRGEYITREQKKQAEDRWISWQKDPKMALPMKAKIDALHLGGTISNAALHDLRYCGGTRRDWYLRMARDKRAA